MTSVSLSLFLAQLTLTSQAWAAASSGQLSTTAANTRKHPLASLELKMAFEEGKALALLCAYKMVTNTRLTRCGESPAHRPMNQDL